MPGLAGILLIEHGARIHVDQQLRIGVRRKRRRDGENEFGLQLITAPGHGGWICRPDVHPIGGGDGSLDVNDLLAYLGLFRAGDRRADLAPTEDGDGVVDVNDLLAFLAAFRAGCPEPAPDPLPPEPR